MTLAPMYVPTRINCNIHIVQLPMDHAFDRNELFEFRFKYGIYIPVETNQIRHVEYILTF